MIQSIPSAWLFVAVAGLLSTLGNLCLKKATVTSGDASFLAMIFQPYFIGGMCFYGMNVILFATALKSLDVSKAYPVLAAIGFSTLSITAAIVFRESLSLTNYLGLLVILVGITMVAL
ncbi:multidrug transporter EmrE-like cation transporter [Alteromonadaceae bacterium 2753L.S.0a.02]|nr:multidrug transporter EmrE-like cation transporter [Alteromonadaceae bacterium 2753L.S.0a.02]